MFSEYNTIKLEINNNKVFRKPKYIWKLATYF